MDGAEGGFGTGVDIVVGGGGGGVEDERIGVAVAEVELGETGRAEEGGEFFERLAGLLFNIGQLGEGCFFDCVHGCGHDTTPGCAYCYWLLPRLDATPRRLGLRC